VSLYGSRAGLTGVGQHHQQTGDKQEKMSDYRLTRIDHFWRELTPSGSNGSDGRQKAAALRRALKRCFYPIQLRRGGRWSVGSFSDEQIRRISANRKS
jgi:hypothetical protein